MSSADDQLFERALLESARADEPPPGAAAESWLRFSSAIAEIAATSTAAERRAPLEASHAARRASSVASRVNAAKWLLIGALGAGVLTAAVIGLRQTSRHPAPAPIARSRPAVAAVARSRPAVARSQPAIATRAEPATRPATTAPSSSSSSDRLETGRSTVSAESAPPLTAADRRDLRAERRGGKRIAPAQTAAPSPVRTASFHSTLSAEVSALDAARAALAARAFDQALQLIDRYRHDFPTGELCADADVVAIEALFAKGDHPAALRQAARFLGQHPKDPHSEAVRRWTQ
jgi:TolA-binding protein